MKNSVLVFFGSFIIGFLLTTLLVLPLFREEEIIVQRIEGKKTVLPPLGWWNTSWQYYKVCNIGNANNNYQMKIVVGQGSGDGGDVHCENNCQDDFGDIRFVDIDNSTVLDFWMENYTSGVQATFWVETPSDVETDGKILLYYGTSESTETTSNGENTFLFFDDFPGSTNTGKWQVSNSATVDWSVDGEVRLSDDGWIQTNDVYGPNKRIRVRCHMNEQDGHFIQVKDNPDGGDWNNYMAMFNSDSSTYDGPNNYDSASLHNKEDGSDTRTSTDNILDFRAWRIWMLTWTPNNVYAYQNDSQYAHHTDNIMEISYYVGFQVWDSSQECTLKVDWIFISEFYDTEPSWTGFSSEKTQDTTTWQVIDDSINGSFYNVSIIKETLGVVACILEFSCLNTTDSIRIYYDTNPGVTTADSYTYTDPEDCNKGERLKRKMIIEGLTENTTYYYRLYNVDTSSWYKQEGNFTTLPRFTSKWVDKFYDTYLISSRSNVDIVQQVGVKDPDNPLISYAYGSQPNGLSYINVIKDNGIWRCWAVNVSDREHPSYLTSSDGVSWSEPQSITINDVGWCAYPSVYNHSGTWYMLYREENQPHGKASICSSTSPGGPYNDIEDYVIDSDLVGDPNEAGIGCFFKDYLRCNIYASAGQYRYYDDSNNRKVGYYLGFDFTDWLHFDTYLNIPTTSYEPGTYSDQVYHFEMSIDEGTYVGFQQFYNGSGGNGVIECYLVVSRDGITWSHIDNSTEIIPLGNDGTWDDGMIFANRKGLTTIGDYTYIYYSGWDDRHENNDRTSRVGRIRFRKDGLSAIQPTSSTGWFLTDPIPSKFVANFTINGNFDSSNTLRIEVVNASSLQPYEGFTFSDFNTIQTNSTSITPMWGENSLAGIPVGDFRLNFSFNGANGVLYAYSIEPGTHYTPLTWQVISSDINGSFYNQISWQRVDDTVNGSFYNQTSWRTVDDSINGQFRNQTSWNLIDDSVNGNFYNQTSWRLVDDSINGQFRNQTSWNLIDDNIDGTFYNQTIWQTIDVSINGNFFNETTWQTVSSDINGNFYNTTVFTLISDNINGSFYNQTSWQRVDDTVNGSFYNQTSFKIISSDINGAFVNVSEFSLIDDSINGVFSNVTSWKLIDNSINGTFYHRISWSIISSDVNGIFSNVISWTIISSDINGSFYNHSKYSLISDDINGTFTNQTSWNLISSDINGVFYHSSSWQLISNDIGGNIYNITSMNLIDDSINGSFYNVTYKKWRIIDDTINGRIYHQSAIPPGWWKSSWKYRKQLRINHSLVDDTLKNFPVLVFLENDGSLSTHAQDNGDDIAFVSYDNVTQLHHEIEFFDGATGDLIAWVNITKVKNNGDTLFWLYYGNSDCSNQENIDETWNSDYLCVFHMNEPSGDIKDVSGYGHHFIDEGSHSYQQPGKIRYGIKGDGDTGCFSNTSMDLTGLTEFTFECWYRIGTKTSMIFSSKYNSADDIRLNYYDGGDNNKGFQSYYDDVGEDGCGVLTHNWNTNSWHYYATTIKNNNASHQYHNLSLECTDDNVNYNFPGLDNLHRIGKRTVSTEKYYDGVLDEIRISRVERNHSWLKATYNTVQNKQDFISIGDEEYYSTIIISDPKPSDGAIKVDLNPRLYITVNETNGKQMNISWFSNCSGSWDKIGEKNNVPNGTYSINTSCFTECLTTYHWRVYVNNGEVTAVSDVYEFTTRDTYIPLDPTNVTTTVYTWDKIKFTWTKGKKADYTLVVEKIGSYPENLSDGAVLYNGTGTQYIATLHDNGHYKLYSYNASGKLYSDGVKAYYGALFVNCYNESKPSQAIGFDLFVTNQNGTNTFSARGCTNTYAVDLKNLPLGDVVVQVSNESYESRYYYYHFEKNKCYRLNAYLPPAKPSWEGDVDVNQTYAKLYLLTVVNEYDQPVKDVRMEFKRYISTTDSYEDISVLYTDASGQVEIYLLPDNVYKVILSKKGYITEIVDYIPSSLIFTHTFRIEFEIEEFEEEVVFNEVVDYEGYVNGSMLYINFSDALNETIDATIHVYEYNHSTGNTTLIASYTRYVRVFQINTTINTSNTHYAYLHLNHSTFGYVTVRLTFPGAREKTAPITTDTKINTLFTHNYGSNPFGWSNFLGFIFIIMFFFAFGQKHSGVGLIMSGFILLFINYVIGLHWAGVSIPILFIIIGLMIMWKRHKEGVF